MAAEVGVVMAASFSTMLLGARLSSSLGPEVRKGVSYLYANLVFPAMVFRGVAAINLTGVDGRLVLTILLSKLAVATACLLFGLMALGSRGLPHAAAYAMAASHSFDVTMGVPMAKVCSSHTHTPNGGSELALCRCRALHPQPTPEISGPWQIVWPALAASAAATSSATGTASAFLQGFFISGPRRCYSRRTSGTSTLTSRLSW